MARLFGTDGIRGLANTEPMTPEMAMALGWAAVQVLAPAKRTTKKPCVLVGRDTRHSGPMLESALLAGLCSAGADVVSVGVLPTPGVAYLTRTLGALAGIMISASHNPYADNGIKFFSGAGTKLDDEIEDKIEACLRASRGTRPTGEAVGTSRYDSEAISGYLDFLMSTFRHPPMRPLRIGLDCANGAASFVAPALFKRLGGEVRVWHAAPDGLNINRQCGSLHPEFLQQHVQAEGLDLGFAFDGDADRLIAIDHTGQILDGDYILAICAQALLQESLLPTRTVVSTVMANLGLELALRKQGIVLHKTQVGDKYVMQGMCQHQAIVGGEQSGHMIFLNYHTTGDGLLSAVQILNAMMLHQMPLAELAQILHKLPQVLVNVRLRERFDPLSRARVQQAVQQVEEALGEEGRVLVRLSGTELVARVMVEGPEKAAIESFVQQIAGAISQEMGPASSV